MGGGGTHVAERGCMHETSALLYGGRSVAWKKTFLKMFPIFFCRIMFKPASGSVLAPGYMIWRRARGRVVSTRKYVWYPSVVVNNALLPLVPIPISPPPSLGSRLLGGARLDRKKKLFLFTARIDRAGISSLVFLFCSVNLIHYF